MLVTWEKKNNFPLKWCLLPMIHKGMKIEKSFLILFHQSSLSASFALQYIAYRLQVYVRDNFDISILYQSSYFSQVAGQPKLAQEDGILDYIQMPSSTYNIPIYESIYSTPSMKHNKVSEKCTEIFRPRIFNLRHKIHLKKKPEKLTTR